MRFPRQLRTLAAGMAGALALAAGSPPAAPTPAMSTHPVPAIGGRAFADFLTPPTTATCLARVHFPCYQPFQMVRAYDLAPLFERHIDGRGRTIVIVDAFGSPTIADDLRTF